MNKKLIKAKETFFEKANIVHNNKYNYSKFVYINSQVKGCIICPIHGEFFQSPSSHLRGYGCPECGKIRQGKKDDKETFIEKAKVVHGNKYDYSKVNYINSGTKVTIICPKHAEFQQTPQNHLNGQGCPKCNGKNFSLKELIDEANKIHNGQYDYSKLNITKKHEKGCIICPKHGVFYQDFSKHLEGQGCPKCAIEKRSQKKKISNKKFTERAEIISKGKDDFSSFKYESMDKKAEFTCNKHGKYWMRPYDYLQGHRCPKCGIVISKAEDEIIDFLENHGITDIIRNDRSILDGMELDIYIPSKKIAIEYNGLKWHSEEFGKNKNYHLNKTEKCVEKGIGLIQIFEDEWNDKKEIVLNKLLHIFNIDIGLPKIMGRKCIIKEIGEE